MHILERSVNGFDARLVIGPIQVGGLLSAALFGCLSCQSYVYFSRFTNDHFALKAAVSRSTAQCSIYLIDHCCGQVSAVLCAPCLTGFFRIPMHVPQLHSTGTLCLHNINIMDNDCQHLWRPISTPGAPSTGRLGHSIERFYSIHCAGKWFRIYFSSLFAYE